MGTRGLYEDAKMKIGEKKNKKALEKGQSGSYQENGKPKTAGDVRREDGRRRRSRRKKIFFT